MGIRFWDTKFRYGISRCALRLGYDMLFGIRNDMRSYQTRIHQTVWTVSYFPKQRTSADQTTRRNPSAPSKAVGSAHGICVHSACTFHQAESLRKSLSGMHPMTPQGVIVSIFFKILFIILLICLFLFLWAQMASLSRPIRLEEAEMRISTAKTRMQKKRYKAVKF